LGQIHMYRDVHRRPPRDAEPGINGRKGTAPGTPARLAAGVAPGVGEASASWFPARLPPDSGFGGALPASSPAGQMVRR
jgi:hypothetical protein